MGYWAGLACSLTGGVRVCVCVRFVLGVCVGCPWGEGVECAGGVCVCVRVYTTLTKHNATTEPKPTQGPTRNPRVKVGCTSQLVDTQ